MKLWLTVQEVEEEKGKFKLSFPVDIIKDIVIIIIGFRVSFMPRLK